MEALKSSIITSKSDLFAVIRSSLEDSGIRDGDVLVITSKVVAVTQGRVVKTSSEKAFNALVQKEADQICGGEKVTLTLKNGIFIPWAGIDRSNTKKGTAVLWPKDPQKTVRQIYAQLKKSYGLKKVGVIISDSFCVPRRRGVTGVALAYAGFEGIIDRRGTKDLYGNTLKLTTEAAADSLATIANFVMGQGREQTPFALVHNAPVTFTDKRTSAEDLIMDEKECLFSPLYQDLSPGLPKIC